jgi:exosortase D (VPLPA-CTERM-specific)
MLMETDSGARGGLASSDPIYRIFIVCLSVLVAVVVFSGPLAELVVRWQKQEEYSYGFLIPVIVAWLLWSRRHALLESVGRPSWIGFGLILVAGAMRIIGELSALFVLSQVGFILVLFGIALGFGGRSLLRVVFVPILFLAFAIPLPYFLDASLSWRLQIVSSQLGVFFIRLFQIPVFLQGNVIDLGVYKLQVVEACSGLRYLYPLLSLSFLAAYLFQAPLWQRAIIFLSAIPITIVMNSVRIALVGILVDHWGPQDAEGLLHFFEGWVIFMACAGILVVEMSLLARLASGKGFFELFYPPTINVPPRSQSQGGRGLNYASPIACLLLLSAVGLAGFFVTSRHEIYPERKSFATFPSTLGDWKGRPSSLAPAVETQLGFSDYVLTDFAKPNGRPVNLYVAYYASQRSGISPHSPSVCIPGGGWRITEYERVHVRNNGIALPINRAIIMRGSDKQLVYYWYEERGVSVANEYWSKLLLLKDAILKNRTDGALIRLTTPVYPGEGEHDADKRLQEFASAAVPTLANFLPKAPSKLTAAMMPLKAAIQR